MSSKDIIAYTLELYNLLRLQGDDNGTKNVAFQANAGSARSKKWKHKDVECFNCGKKGHMKADCWAKGGRKEGQGPQSKKGKSKKNSVKTDSANAVAEMPEKTPDGVWMAIALESGCI